MKKLFAILLTLAMLLSLSISVLADESEIPGEGDYILTFTGIEGHTYHLYQLLTGKVSEEAGKPVLSNVLYGHNSNNPGAEAPESLLEDWSTAEDLAGTLANVQIPGDPFWIINPNRTDTSFQLKVVGGYYMIEDVTNPSVMPDGQTASPIILQVLETTHIASKHATISSEKLVADRNDSTDPANADPSWGKSADYDIGDDVLFQLSVDLPTTMPSYGDDYTLTFHDAQPAGLSDDIKNIKAYILKKNGTKITIDESEDGAPGYVLSTTCTPRSEEEVCEFENCSFNISVIDINALYGENAYAEGDKLFVEYTSELLSNAVAGRDGNINSMYVCHPDGHTPIDSVTVLTYQLDITKIDGATGDDLLGAKFTLYKWIATTNDQGSWVIVGTEQDGTDTANFTWKGLDDGKYKLVESDTPRNYNTLKDKIFVITARHKTDWIPGGGNRAFLDVLATNESGSVVEFADSDGTIEDGILSGQVANHKGAALPETGAQGTFLLIAGGTLLVLVAAVFMITRKKMSIYED